MFELPGFTAADSGKAVNSLDALRTASATSWFSDDDALWVKVVSNGDIPGRGPGQGPGQGERVQVSR